MNKIFVLADIHGKHQPIGYCYARNKDKENFDGSDVIIILGDAGVNYFGDYRDDNLKNALCKYPFTYFLIRGNHEQRPSILAEENPDKWTSEVFWEGAVYVEKKMSSN